MKVLLTGGSGFVGRHCLECLISHGHDVVTTVRSNAKGQQILNAHPSLPSNRLSYAVVEDIASQGAFDQVVQSVPSFEAVMHTASPFHYKATDPKKELIDPAVNGTLGILQSIKDHAPTVKRVVITSSFASIVNFHSPPKVYTSDMWNPITLEDAAKEGYSSLDEINTSNARFADILLGKMRDKIAPASFFWVDVRDVALAHLRAMELPEAAGQRFIASTGRFSNAKLAQIIKEKFPDLANKLPERIDVKPEEEYPRIDNTPIQQLLGIQLRDLESSVCDTIKSLRGILE